MTLLIGTCLLIIIYADATESVHPGVTRFSKPIVDTRTDICRTINCATTSHNILQLANLSVNPCDDFYSYVCGRFKDAGVDTVYEVVMNIQEKLQRFLSSENNARESNAVKMSQTMYKACMREEQMNRLGLYPALKYLRLMGLPSYPSILDELAADGASFSRDKFDWIKSIAKIKKYLCIDMLIGFHIVSNPVNQTEKFVYLGKSAGTVLSFNVHFKKILGKIVDDAKELKVSNTEALNNSTEIKFMAWVIKKFATYSTHSIDSERAPVLIDDAIKVLIKVATTVSQLEERAKNSSMKYAEFTENERLILTVDELQNATARGLSKSASFFKKYLNIISHDLHPRKILTSKTGVYYLQILFQYIETLTDTELELFIWWSVVEQIMMHTTSDIRDIHDEYFFEGKPMYREDFCSFYVNEFMVMATTRAVVDPNFSTETKPTINNMLDNIRKVFDELVLQTPWMDDETKRSTLEKSAAIKGFVGYPEWILNGTLLDQSYDGLKFNEDKHFTNMMHALEWCTSSTLKQLHQPDSIDYNMPATAVNAFYSNQYNTILIPIAYAQYPLWNLGLKALDYGRMGSTLAHEWAHGFDSTGRTYDKTGNMKQWWTDKTIAEYNKRTSCFVEQYNNYYVQEISEYIDGELTLDENIADNLGLRLAYYAYQLHIKEHGREQQRLFGLEHFTHEQLFFMLFPAHFCTSADKISKQKPWKDTHSPAMYRVNGAVSNFHEFSRAFNCKPSNRMYSHNECRLW